MSDKKATSYRLTSEAHDLLAGTALKLGIAQQAVLELAIRAYAKQQGVTAPTPRD